MKCLYMSLGGVLNYYYITLQGEELSSVMPSWLISFAKKKKKKKKKSIIFKCFDFVAIGS